MGGIDLRDQDGGLHQGVHMIVATPGRLQALQRSSGIDRSPHWL
jgi:superfamily II DNA/RNA helicase